MIKTRINFTNIPDTFLKYNKRSTIENRKNYSRQLCCDAILYLSEMDGPVSNKQLAKALGVDPRGLRVALNPVIDRIIIDIRDDVTKKNGAAPKKRGTPFYRLRMGP